MREIDENNGRRRGRGLAARRSISSRTSSRSSASSSRHWDSASGANSGTKLIPQLRQGNGAALLPHLRGLLRTGAGFGFAGSRERVEEGDGGHTTDSSRRDVPHANRIQSVFEKVAPQRLTAIGDQNPCGPHVADGASPGAPPAAAPS